MKIAIYHNLPSGGAKRALYEWTRRLAAVNTIDIYSLSTADHAFCDLQPFVRAYQILGFSPNRLFESPFGRLNRLQRWRDLGELARIGRRIARTIDAADYDVVFVHPCLYTFIPVFLRFLQTPSLYYLHEPFGPTFVRQFERPYLENDSRWKEMSKRIDPFHIIYHRRLEHFRAASIQRTTRLLANSEFTQQEMEKQYGVQAPVCRYGVNIQEFSQMPDIRKENVVLSVGAITPRKGFAFLIESLARIPHHQRPLLKLVSNGEVEAERLYVQSLALELGVELEILVRLDSVRLAQEYNKARLVVYSPILEPFGLVPLEAMACGTPVVGVREGGVPESVVDGVTGVLVERDPAQFALAIQELLIDRERLDSYGRNGWEHVRRTWGWDQTVSHLQSHLEEVAGA
jgi:glycosyltransferase involved in cell wall biosynthesis